MNRTRLVSFIILACLGIISLGCQQRPAVPTVPLEPTESVIVVVVTATSQPTLAPSSTPEATITPLPTFTPVQLTTITATVHAITVAPTARPPATVGTQATQEPTQEPATTTPQATALPSSFSAPMVFSPVDKAFRNGDTVKVEFGSVGPLAPDQCYRIEMTLGNPTGPGGVGDYWVPTNLCGDQSSAGSRLIFELKPGRFRDEPNYGALLVSADEIVPPTPQYVMQLIVSVVRLVDTADPIHPNVEALSPASAGLQNSFFR